MEKTKRLLKIHLGSSILYLFAQELLNVYIYWTNAKDKLETFNYHRLYFDAPAISAILILSAHLIMKRTYCPPKEHYLLYAIAWFFLFIPQIIPPFCCGLNIIYTTWTFVLVTTVAGIVIFHDLALTENVNNLSKNGSKFIYDELKFYLDKLFIAWLTLGTVLAVCMTILWTAPMTSFDMVYKERVFWAVYMLFCFLMVTMLVCIFVGYPIMKNITKVRKAILNE